MLSEMAGSMSIMYLICDYNCSVMQITQLPFSITIIILIINRWLLLLQLKANYLEFAND